MTSATDIDPTPDPFSNPSPEPSSTAQSSVQPPARPPASRPELARPRLADLFVLTAMMAVFLTCCRYAFSSEVNFALWPLNEWELFGYGAGVACCWAGVYRMLRPYGGPALRPAEWQPGEVICLIEGGYYLAAAILSAYLRHELLGGRVEVPKDDDTFVQTFEYEMVAALQLLPTIGVATGYGLMANWLSAPWWRTAAVAKAAGHTCGAIYLFLVTSELSSIDWGEFSVYALPACFAIPTLLVGIAAIADRKRAGVHWLHWLGLSAFALIYVSRLSLELRLAFF